MTSEIIQSDEELFKVIITMKVYGEGKWILASLAALKEE